MNWTGTKEPRALDEGRLPAYRWPRFSLRPHLFQPRRCDHALVERIQVVSKEIATRPDRELGPMFRVLAREVRAGRDPLDRKLLTSGFALVSEAIRRVLGWRYYDVQFLAGIALAAGAIAEMKTGEGKTIVAALPASLWALHGRGVHVATVNAYLAKRDFEQLKPVYEMLGLTAAQLEDGSSVEQKQQAYAADVIYGTGYEFGFDYLRDQSARLSRPKTRLGSRLREQLQGTSPRDIGIVQRPLAFAIIDEVDSVLLDEANVPLIISMSPDEAVRQTLLYDRAAAIARGLEAQVHYLLRPRERTVSLTEAGRARLFATGQWSVASGLVRPWSVYVEQALRADLLMRRDVDYVVQDDKVLLVDQYTGRIFPDRTWQDGLHQAIEFKEGVTVTAEKRALARISRQRFYGLYDRICGMTGTAVGHEMELWRVYQLPIVVIPERLPSQRKTWPLRAFLTNGDKWNAIADEICELQRVGRPVLVGTSSIDESRRLARLLHERSIPFRLLNGIQDEEEAQIVSRAGNRATVTIATNMAGRGTDIKIAAEVAELGGLHVIASQRQESRRVDRQLIGRTARQGDPGTSRFFVSLEDPLIEQFGSALLPTLRATCGRQPEDPRVFEQLLDRIQSAAEGHKQEVRQDLHRHDCWLNEVLTTVAERSQVS